MREGIPARVSEIDPTRFWVWVSNSELVPMLRKSQLPPTPRIRSPHSPHSFALFPAYAHSFATLSRHERGLPCVPSNPKRFLAGGRVLSVIVSLFTSTPEDTGPAYTQILP